MKWLVTQKNDLKHPEKLYQPELDIVIEIATLGWENYGVVRHHSETPEKGYCLYSGSFEECLKYYKGVVYSLDVYDPTGVLDYIEKTFAPKE